MNEDKDCMIFVKKRMQNYIEGTNCCQSYFNTLEAQVSADNAVRLMDAFIDKLDPIAIGLEKLGVTKTVHKSESLPGRLQPIQKLAKAGGK